MERLKCSALAHGWSECQPVLMLKGILHGLGCLLEIIATQTMYGFVKCSCELFRIVVGSEIYTKWDDCSFNEEGSSSNRQPNKPTLSASGRNLIFSAFHFHYFFFALNGLHDRSNFHAFPCYISSLATRLPCLFRLLSLSLSRNNSIFQIFPQKSDDKFQFPAEVAWIPS